LRQSRSGRLIFYPRSGSCGEGVIAMAQALVYLFVVLVIVVCIWLLLGGSVG